MLTVRSRMDELTECCRTELIKRDENQLLARKSAPMQNLLKLTGAGNSLVSSVNRSFLPDEFTFSRKAGCVIRCGAPYRQTACVVALTAGIPLSQLLGSLKSLPLGGSPITAAEHVRPAQLNRRCEKNYRRIQLWPSSSTIARW